MVTYMHSARTCFFAAVIAALSLGVIAFAAVSPGAARQSQRRGKLFINVSDAKTRTPLKGVAVEVYPAEPGPGFGLETGKRGDAAHISVPEGVYQATISHSGYAPVEIANLVIIDNRPARIAVEMLRAEIAPYKVKRVRYEPPTLDTEAAGLRTIFRVN